MYSFEFELGQFVKNKESDEEGEVIGIAKYTYFGDSYLVRYKEDDGLSVEKWWDAGTISALAD